MAVEMLLLAKLKLILAIHSNWQLLYSLLWAFVLKFCFIKYMPRSLSELLIRARTFIFWLNRRFFIDSPVRILPQRMRFGRNLEHRMVEDPWSEFMLSYGETITAMAMLSDY
ncbi:hypothetical protein IHE45_01G085700 [Dioscorea alata]|uniref:Uncharacterized protein n=1 Tax=Dioscorea alata TaxID=55571 RepID=A0ACB7WVB0_DIOAL|nr:hypothetical protein IHE45_01G085700 [Dioscorea alata]